VLKKKVSKGKPRSTADAPHGSAPPPAQDVASATKKPAPRRTAVARKRAGATSAAPTAARPRKPQATADTDVIRAVIAPQFDVLRDEIRGVTTVLERLATTPSSTDAAVEASVDALRRVLSDLIEQRTESVVKELVDVRRDAASLAAQGGARIVERLEHLIEDLGAVRFEADVMDVVDPLIHVVVEERQQADAPDGVILETVRPGYRTARGMVVCKAAVVVNQRA
jgi:molecular chaperone GrpE (heat shock protein)